MKLFLINFPDLQMSIMEMIFLVLVSKQIIAYTYSFKIKKRVYAFRISFIV